MATTLTGTGVTFTRGNSQTEAVNTTWGGVGSYAVCYLVGPSPATVAGNGTVAGSQLQYATNGYALGILTSGSSNYYMQGTLVGSVTRTTLSFSGTWRVMASPNLVVSTSTPQLLVRIS